MEFGKYLAKGIWGLADKALPVVYGVGYVWLVIRVLPEEEFGNFVLVQEVFLVISGLATAFALQPLLKFSSEENARLGGIVSAALVLNAFFIAAASLVVAGCSAPAGKIFNSPSLTPTADESSTRSFRRNPRSGQIQNAQRKSRARFRTGLLQG